MWGRCYSHSTERKSWDWLSNWQLLTTGNRQGGDLKTGLPDSKSTNSAQETKVFQLLWLCNRFPSKHSGIISSIAQSCLTLCDPWTAACQASLSITSSRSLLKLVQRISDAIQLSHSLLSPSAFNLSQHQGLFQWVSFFASGGQKLELQL